MYGKLSIGTQAFFLENSSRSRHFNPSGLLFLANGSIEMHVLSQRHVLCTPLLSATATINQ
jgi:hypothetical protein